MLVFILFWVAFVTLNCMNYLQWLFSLFLSHVYELLSGVSCVVWLQVLHTVVVIDSILLLTGFVRAVIVAIFYIYFFGTTFTVGFARVVKSLHFKCQDMSFGAKVCTARIFLLLVGWIFLIRRPSFKLRHFQVVLCVLRTIIVNWFVQTSSFFIRNILNFFFVFCARSISFRQAVSVEVFILFGVMVVTLYCIDFILTLSAFDIQVQFYDFSMMFKLMI